MTTKQASQVEIILPALHEHQLYVQKHSTRFTVMVCGRRYGKTEYVKRWFNTDLLYGYPVAYFCPTYKMLSEVWDAMVLRYKDLIVDISEQEKHFKLVTGGIFDCWSEHNFDSVRGRKYKKVALDEACKYAKGANAWTQAIRPTLSDYRGEALFPTTPNGHDWIFALFNRGVDPEFPKWSSFQAPTSKNPYIHPSEIIDAKHDLPDRIFRQEYLAEFLEDGSGVFRGVSKVCTIKIGSFKPDPDRRYVFGLDWAKINDFTVLAIMDVTDSMHPFQVHIERFQDIDFSVQINRILGVLTYWNPIFGYVEMNGIGEMPYQELAKKYRYCNPWYTTNDNKNTIISGLASGMEKRAAEIPLPGGCTLLDDPYLKSELMSFEVKRLVSGKWRYGAVEGAHDDIVIATALMWQAKNDYKRTGGIYV